MNKIKGIVKQVETDGSLSIVQLSVGESLIQAIVIETPKTATYLQQGKTIYIVFKATEVGIGKNITGQISLRNQLPCTILAIEKSKLLSNITLQFEGNTIDAIITTAATQQLDLKKGEQVTALIKINEVMLSPQ